MAKKPEETTPDSGFALAKENYIYLIIGFVVIIIGFLLMMGGNHPIPRSSMQRNFSVSGA